MPDADYDLYLKLFVKALHGVRATLRETDPEWVEKMTWLIELPRTTFDETQIFLLHAHKAVIEGRSTVAKTDPEAASLLDAVHNIPYGLLGRYDGGWNWKGSLPDILREHERNYLRGLKKYSGLLQSHKPPK